MRANRCFDTINGVKNSSSRAKTIRCVSCFNVCTVSMYLFIIRGCSTFDCDFFFLASLFWAISLTYFCSSSVHHSQVYSALSKRISSVLIKNGLNRKRRGNSNKSHSKQKMWLIHTIWPTEQSARVHEKNRKNALFIASQRKPALHIIFQCDAQKSNHG